MACCLLKCKIRRKIPVIFFRMGGSLVGTAWLFIESETVEDPIMIDPVLYAFVMTATILSVVVLILTIEKVCLRIKQIEQRKKPEMLISSDTEFIK